VHFDERALPGIAAVDDQARSVSELHAQRKGDTHDQLRFPFGLDNLDGGQERIVLLPCFGARGADLLEAVS